MSTHITVVPDPLQQGQQGKVCYDFAAAGETHPITLTIEWTLIDGTLSSETVTVDPKENCHAVTPPSDAVGVQVTDPTGSSSDYAGAVVPPPAPIG